MILHYEEYSIDCVMNGDGEFLEERRKRTRPYALRSDKKETRTFGNLESAIVIFMEWASELAPEKKTIN
jgi:hypothetical protein